MRKLKRIVVAVAAGVLVLIESASADVDCRGEVTNLSLQLDGNGQVTLSLSGGPNYTYLCSVDAVRNGVSPTVCRMMYATLVTAKTTGKKVSIRFYNYNSCSAIPPWADSGTLGWTILLTE
jgi:hypothetical protein